MGRAATVIAAGTTVSGRIEGAEDVEVLGTIKGSVQLDGALWVDEQARVEADLELTSVEVHGILVGDVRARESIVLHATAQVIGDLTAPRLVLEEGARFRGAIDMGEAPGESGAERRPTRGRPAKRPPTRSPAPRGAASSAAPAPKGPAEGEEPALPKAAKAKKVAVKKRT